MNIGQLLYNLRKLKIEISLIEDKLIIDAPKGLLTKEMLAEIKNKKMQ